MIPEEWLQSAARRLGRAGIENARREARYLLQASLEVAPDEIIHGHVSLSADQEKKADSFLSRRERREPLARLKGQREFWKAFFALNEATLEPRPETETLIEAALEIFSDREAPLRMLDLGTGSGCILLSLLQEFPKASGIGTDISLRALGAAEENTQTLGLQDRAQFICADWAEGMEEKFDLIISNPPYIASPDIPALQPEVRLYDPALALDGGADGLAAYRALARICGGLLKPRGKVIVEIGWGQAEKTAEIFANAGFRLAASRKDLGGIPRALTFHY